jgi:hypothetical protein
MDNVYSKTRICGRDTLVPSTIINDRNVIVTGRFIRIAAVQDETCVEGEIVPDPERFVRCLRLWEIKPDIFTFPQKVNDPTPRFQYKCEWDNFAVIPITSYDDWFRNRVRPDVRQNIRRAKREGIVTKCVAFNDALVWQIKEICDETPVRQGMRFWHYGKKFEEIKEVHGTYSSRADYIGAYLGDELIGFVKLVYVGRIARTMNVISKQRYFHLRPTNALIAKAVEVCAQRNVSHLVYGEYRFPGKTQSSLAEFKKRNGFEEALCPRYFIPLTAKGSLVIRLGLHRGLKRYLPEPLSRLLLTVRQWLLRVRAPNPNSARQSDLTIA